MFQDAMFFPERRPGVRAIALPAAILAHAVVLALLATAPLLRVGELPAVDVSNILVAPALPSTPLPPPKARAGNPGARIKARRAPVVAADPWRLAPVDVPDGIVEETDFGADGMPGGIDGGVDYGTDAGILSDIAGAGYYAPVGEPAEPVVRAVGDVKPPRLVRRVEPDYPAIAREARIEGTVILEATTDVFGRVTGVRVLRSVALLDEAALAAVRQWVYEPLVVNGRPRPVTFTVTVRFMLQK
jgi:protein TonB